MLSSRIKNLQESATLAISSKAKEMRKKGIQVIDFSVGEPDFDTPENIKEAAKDALRNGFTKYTNASGIPELKEAVSKKLKKENNLSCSPDEVIVSNGAKHAIFNALFALLDKNDEVIISVPYWTSYGEQVKLVGGTPIFAETDNFDIDPSRIMEKTTKKTKLIIINSPNNPSGFVYNRESLKKIAKFAVENNIFVLSDEVYEKLTYEDEHFSIGAINNEIKRLTITVNALSKTYSMTGWRIGYAAAPYELIKAMSDIQSQTTSNPNSIAQYAALEALNGNQDYVKKSREEFKKRRDYFVQRIDTIKEINCQKPKGAFFVFPDFSSKEKNSIKLSTDLLEKAKIATVPGTAFGQEGHIRFSYATSRENIKEGLDRLENFVKNLK